MLKESGIKKKYLSVLLAFLIVLSTMVFSALTAFAADGNDSVSAVNSVKSVNSENALLDTPQLSIVEGAASGISLNWSKVTGAEKYRVFYKTESSDWTYICDTASTSYTWTGAKSGTKYTFTVRCVSNDGKSYTSDYDHTGTTLEYAATPKFTSVNAVSTGIQIAWGKTEDVSKYRLFYKNNNGGWTKITDTTSTSYTWTGAEFGTKYTFTVRCLSDDGTKYTSWFDTAGMSITYVSTPKLSVVEGAASGVSLNWNKVTGAEKYRVFYKTGSSDWTYICDTASTSYTWTGAKSGTKYTFTVRCVSNDGKSYMSDYDRTGTTLEYVATPKFASVNAVSTGIQIVWGKVEGAAKYRVFYKNSNGGWTKIADTASTSYTWTGAEFGTKYTFTVRCLSDDGKKYTSWFDSVGMGITYVSTPKISTVEATASGIQINWGKVTGAEKYRVFYKTGSSDWTYVCDTTSTSYTWTGAKSGSKYTFTVRCLTSNGKSYTSDYDHTGTTIEYTATPKFTSVNAVSTGIQIVWGKVEGAAKYRVFYKNSNGGWTKITDTTSTSFTWTGAKSGTKYTFTVRCLSGDGTKYTSWFDTVGMGITYVSTPKISTVEATTTGIQINWGKVTGAEKYRVFYKTGSSDWTYVCDTTSTSYMWTGAKSGTKYTFTVRCLTSNGKSYASDYDHTGTTIEYTATPKFTSVNAVANGIQIVWGKVEGAAKYRVFYRNSSGGWTKITDTTATSFTWTGAKLGTKYTFTVRCLSDDGTKYTSWFDTVGMGITYVSTPKITSASSANSGVQISWGGISGAEKYRVFYKTGSGDWTYVCDTTSTSYTWTGAVGGTKYTFTVRCVSSDGKRYASYYDTVGVSATYYGLTLNSKANAASEKYSNCTRYVYGTTAMGYQLEAYIINGNGNNSRILFMDFAVHGFEDEYANDGKVLVTLGNGLVEYYSAHPELLGNYRLVIVPCANPDGTMFGRNNYRANVGGAFGRCTYKGIDINRDFQSGGFRAVESVALRNLMNKYNPDVYLNFHGWEDSVIGNPQLVSIFRSKVGLTTDKSNRYASDQGFIIAYVKDHYNAKAALVEFRNSRSVDQSKVINAINSVISNRL